MKIYVPYETLNVGERSHRYFLYKSIAEGELAGEEYWYNEAGLESYWKVKEVETEDQ